MNKKDSLIYMAARWANSQPDRGPHGPRPLPANMKEKLAAVGVDITSTDSAQLCDELWGRFGADGMPPSIVPVQLPDYWFYPPSSKTT